jgi:3-oxoacid CoA-transferase B subunit
VDRDGTLANYAVPGRPLLGVGGAKDLARGARRVIATMLHNTKDGRPKLVERCDLPITAPHCVDTVVTELGLFRVRGGELLLDEIAAGITLDELRARTGASFSVSPDLRTMPE